ncbi:MAG: ABC transporter permease [Actinomycetota bacterium]|nr:ABC transporter permease [Actinomycetota bacterium]
MIALSIVELRLLLRRRVTAFSVVVVPLGLVALTLFGQRPDDPALWGRLLSTNFQLLTMLSAYLVSLTVFTARRQSRVLKRLRTSELSDTAILGGVLAPVFVVGLAQTAAYLVFCVVIGAPVPEDPVAVVAGVVLGVVVATAAGVATACLTRTVEATQLTGTPVLLAAVGGMFMTPSSEPALATIGLLMPIAGPGDLVARGWGAGVTEAALPAVPLGLAATVLWLAVSGVVFHRAFRWEPRA